MMFMGVDSLTISGQDSRGRYWKVVKNKYAIYVYSKVPPEKKQIFDSALSSATFIKVKDNSGEKTVIPKSKQYFDYSEIKCKHY